MQHLAKLPEEVCPQSHACITGSHSRMTDRVVGEERAGGREVGGVGGRGAQEMFVLQYIPEGETGAFWSCFCLTHVCTK